jgi:hypothetical protein
VARRIPFARASAALAKQRAGQALSPGEQLALDKLQQRLGLDRPLIEYAARTQRRYLQAAREGLTVKEINRREWRLRPDALTGPARRKEIERLRALIDGSTLNTEYHSREDIEDLIDLYGERFVLRVLSDQVDSMIAYSEGRDVLGNRRWDKRVMLIDQYRDDMVLDEIADPYFWYHGSIT